MKRLVVSLLCIVFLRGAGAADPVPESSSERLHTIMAGDTLARIAKTYYGDTRLYPYLARVNRIPNPHLIFAGKSLTIPPPPKEVLDSLKNMPLIVPGTADTAAAPAEAPLLQPATAQFLWIKEPNNAFAPGEKLTFSIRWQFISVGSATMEVQGIEEINGRQAYHIVTTARSAAFFDNFYKVRDTNESWMDVESLSSLKFASHLSEGSYKMDETVLLDHEKRTFRIEESGKTGEIPPWVKDVLSSMYYLRTRELAENGEYLIDAHNGDKSWPLKVRVMRRETIDSGIGKVDCLVVEPSLRENAGIFRAQGTLEIWLTNDQRKLPVLMRSKISVGAIEARLVNMKLP